MSITLPPKSPDEVVVRGFDWSPVIGEDWITNATLSVASGTVAFANLQWTPSAIYFTISGGAQGETTTFLNTIMTEGGQTLEQTLSIYIEAEAVETPFGPSTMTKGDIVTLSYEEIGLPGYEFDMSPEEWASTLRKLDILMAARPYAGLPLGYNFPATIGNSDKLDAFGVADTLGETISIALAKRVAPSKGKTISGSTTRTYNEGINNLIAQASSIPQAIRSTNTPVGMGNRYLSVWAPYALGWWRWR